MKQDVADHKIQQFISPLTELGPEHYSLVQAAQFPKKILRYKNELLNIEVDLKVLNSKFEWNFFCDFPPFNQEYSQPRALKYHGHQFRIYNPELGDGRGFTYLQFKKNNQWFEIGTKGSGSTPYSRSGDGKLTLKGAFREALATELLESYGVNTSKTVCIFETGESLIRYDEPSPTRSAVLTRLSRNHIRIGTFQRLAYNQNKLELQRLLLITMKSYFAQEFSHAELMQIDALLKSETMNENINKTTSKNVTINISENLIERFLQIVCQKLAHLSAQAMMAGFVHGVLNTDNINITGELFDYGPYRFLPHYDPKFTAAYFDGQGLYAYGEQPQSFYWGFYQLGLSLKTIHPNLELDLFEEAFQLQFYDSLYLQLENKLNYRFQSDEISAKVLHLCFSILATQQHLFEEFFFYINSANLQKNKDNLLAHYAKHFKEKQNLLSELIEILEKSEIKFPDKNKHLYFKQDQPCTLLIDEIESIWRPIAENDDWSLFNAKIAAIRKMRGIY